jgi:hypothetical protein
MSKKGRKPTESKKKVPKGRTKKQIEPRKEGPLLKGIHNPIPESPQDSLFRKIFNISFGVMLVLAILMAMQTGINEDEKFHHGYENVLMKFYGSFGEDKSALQVDYGKMHYYGGLFDIVTGMTNRALGNTSPDEPAFHKVRHFYNALFGCLAMLFTALLARQIGGWRAALLALYFMFLSPRFLGHTMMNPRDIPFAAGYIMAIYFMVRLLKEMPKPKWYLVLGLGGGIALSIGARAGGFLLIAYLGLFALVDFFVKYRFSGLSTHGKTFLEYVKYPAIATLGGVGVALLFWPYGLVDPFSNVIKAVTEFSNYSTNIRMLFSGELMWAQSLPLFNYMISWMGLTIPLFTILGIITFLVFLPRIYAKYPFLPITAALFTLIFPVFYVLFKQSTLYDGWRHLTFVYTPAVALAAVGWSYMIGRFESQRTLQYGLLGILGLLLLEPASFIVRNPSYAYVYFNPLAGGISGAFGNYEQDYWGVSVKKAIDWMDKEGIIGENMQDTITISSNFGYVTKKYTAKYKGKVKPQYSRFRERYDKDWDYAIYVGRFVDAGQLQSGKWPSSKAIHIIRANGVPLAAIYKNTDKRAYMGYQAAKKGNWQEVIANLEPEVEAYPDNDLAWMHLGSAYINTGKQQQGEEALAKALEINPDNTQALSFLANLYVSTGKVGEAKKIYLKILEISESNYVAYYYLAAIEQQQNNLNAALEYGKKAIGYNPRFKQGYELVARIYEQMGDAQTAQQYRAAMNKIQ